MKSSSSSRLMWLVILVLHALTIQFQISLCTGCLEIERTALLQIKVSMSEYPSSFTYFSFDSWYSGYGNEGGSSDCFTWKGVECNVTTGKVIKLVLSFASQEWPLNASLFTPFEDLTHLDLSWNDISSWVPNQDLGRLSVLPKLQVLILDYNHFNSTILPSLGELSSLRTLSLKENNFEGSFDFGGLGRLPVLPKLQVLILDGNYFNSTVLPSLGELSSLRTLSLSGNRFEGSFDFGEFHNMTNLYKLGLIGNSINAIKGLGRLSVLPKLQVLTLDENNFNSTILPPHGKLSSLRTLSLSLNKFEGSFDFGEFHNMTNLYELNQEGNYVNAIKGLGRLNNSILPSIGLPSTLKALSLAYNKFTGSFDVRELSYMSNLEELDLSYNYDVTDVKGLESLSKMTILNLREMKLNESSCSVLQSVSALRSLKTLDMSDNNLKCLSLTNGSFGFSNLQELDLSLNDLEGKIPSWLGNFTSLRFLDLSYNQFEGNLGLSPVADLHTLECLIISHNNLEIPMSLTSFYNHSKLKVLKTDYNRKLLSDKVEFHLPRAIPKFQLELLSFSNCGSNNLITRLPDLFHFQSHLRMVDISQINLAMPFPTWLFKNNTLLEECYMKNNSLTGSFLFPSHHPFPQITVIDISYNHLAGQVLENIGRVFPRLLKLDLSNNNLSGEIPTINCPSLSFLKLSHNNLSGQLSPSLYKLTSLEFLLLDDNHFVGEILDNFPSFSLRVIDLSNNHISGKLPRWIGNMTVLMSLAMASNQLEGAIPMEFCNLGSLFEFLDLSDNDLSGPIPSCFNPPNIWHVHLNRNKLSGPMTRAFHNSSSLVTLDLLDNNLTGTIPRWIGTISSLSVLLLKNNNFEGDIPQQLCSLESLSLLDLSQNNLFGRLPLCLSNMSFGTSDEKSSGTGFSWGSGYSWTNIYDQYPKRLKLGGGSNDDSGYTYRVATNQRAEFSTKFGSYSYKGRILNLMSGIDLSCNHLTGEIPAGIGSLSTILVLNLSHNNLTGPIPTTFSKLAAIESLDLSYNNLNGRIPSQLVDLVRLEIFSVAHNNLSGSVPDRKAQFGTFDERSYEGNPLLCGPPLRDSCSTRTGTREAKPKTPANKINRGEMVDFYASCIASYVTVLITIAAILLINPRWRRVWFYSIEVWMTSSYYFVWDNFSRLINRRR